MIRALNTAATGMQSQETMVNTIANNLANVNTNGFKQSNTEFEDLLYQTVQEPGAKLSDSTSNVIGQQIGSGSKVSAIKKDFTQGSSQITSNPYDLMIQGEGFFKIIGPNEQIFYTKDGSLSPDASGKLTTKSGYKLYPEIIVPPNTSNLHIGENGEVQAYTNGKTEPVTLGSIPLFTFTNPTGLKSTGKNLYAETASSGTATENQAGASTAGTIMQGALETSNVNMMAEMNNLIKAQRAYEMNSKVMSIADQMLQTVNNIK
jgi:flagellar basal-body rod protein FlgG